MKPIKANAAELIRVLPEDASLEDIQYHLYVLENLQKGQQAIRNG